MAGLEPSSSGAARHTCRRGWPGAAPRVVGIDNSERQLVTARRLAAEHGVELTLIHGNAEAVPYPDALVRLRHLRVRRGDLVRPVRVDPEAHRLLRPGGTLVFLGTLALASLCSPVDGSLPITERLDRDYFSMHRLDWRERRRRARRHRVQSADLALDPAVRQTGFEILEFIEIQAPEASAGGGSRDALLRHRRVGAPVPQRAGLGAAQALTA